MPAAALLVMAAVLVVALQPFRGAVVVTLTAGHGVHIGDLLAVPPLLAAAWMLGIRHPGAAPWGAPALAPLGAALVLIGTLDLSGAADQAPPTAALAGTLGLLALAAISGLAVWSVRPAPDRLRPSTRWAARVPPVALVLGYLVDTALLPSGTVTGPLLLAAALAAAGRGARRRRFGGVAGVLALANVVALADVAGLDSLLASGGGGGARTLALGLVLAAGALRPNPGHRSAA